MTKTKKQLRAEAVERLKNCVAARFDAESIVIALTSGRHGQSDWSLECDKLIYLLTDDANDDLAHESDVRTASVDANDVKVSTMPLKMPSEIRWHYMDGGEYTQELTGDSREKLEAEASELVAEYAASGDVCDALYHGMLELLDRQAAITQHEITERWAEHLHPIERECGDLRRKVAELTSDNDRLAKLLSKSLEEYDILEAERDKLQEQLRIGWECECRLQAERDNLAADLMRANNERERYREKFGKCIDYADAIHALMDDEGTA